MAASSTVRPLKPDPNLDKLSTLLTLMFAHIKEHDCKHCEKLLRSAAFSE